MTLFLHRFNVKPRHLDAYLELWPREVELRARHGFSFRQAYLETHAEPKVTWIYQTAPHCNSQESLACLQADPEVIALEQAKAPHVFRNLVIRPVESEILPTAMPIIRPDHTVVLRRYSIVGDWTQFLQIWRRIVPVRERYGFRPLFAVADQPTNMFTWAFDYCGRWEEFPARQRDYYHDPARVELRGVFDYLADYVISPAEALALPS